METPVFIQNTDEMSFLFGNNIVSKSRVHFNVNGRYRTTHNYTFFIYIYYYYFILLALQPTVGFSLLDTLSDTPQSIGLLWTRDQPVAETYT
jgi:hypothetical protein